ncbi:MAG: metallophosphoesterase [Acidimicrobiia bacterium]
MTASSPSVARGRGPLRRAPRAAGRVLRSGWGRADRARTIRRRLRIVAFAVAGAALGLALAGQVPARIGPFDATIQARPSLRGETLVRLAPLGNLRLDTHAAPLTLEVRVDQLRLDEAERIAGDPRVLTSLEDDIADDAGRALRRLALRAFVVAVVGGALGALAASVRLRAAALGGLVGGLLTVSVGGAAAVTFDAEAVAEPEYSGLLTAAPTAVGDLEKVVDRFGEYRAQLTELVGNVLALYRAAAGLPDLSPGDDTVRVLHVSDIHLNPQAFDLAALLIEQFDVDAVVDTGDITDWGSVPESRLVERIGTLGVPYVWVRGNHDSASTQAVVAAQPNAVVLDGDAATVAGLRFWGIGDPRYTPDKDQVADGATEREQADAFAPEVARRLGADEPPDVDVALVHDARIAAGLGGRVPLVLAGHSHEARQGTIGTTTLLVEGSTGGAGLRSLQGETPEPLTCSILYFDPSTDRLVAYDRVTVRGLGEAGARIERHVLPPTRPN